MRSRPGRLARRSRRRSRRNVALVSCWLVVASSVGLAAAYTTTTVDAGRGPVTVYVPNGYSAGTPVPLLLLLHGYSSSGPAVESYIGYLSAVDARGFAYAFPSGRVDSFGQRFWTATDACCNLFNQGGPNDDSQYLRTLIDRIRQTLAIDDARIWLAGHSNGGFMSHRMACDHSEIIAGIVSLAGATFSNPAACAALQPVHVLQIHGTSDNVILYGGERWRAEDATVPLSLISPAASDGEEGGSQGCSSSLAGTKSDFRANARGAPRAGGDRGVRVPGDVGARLSRAWRMERPDGISRR